MLSYLLNNLFPLLCIGLLICLVRSNESERYWTASVPCVLVLLYIQAFSGVSH